MSLVEKCSVFVETERKSDNDKDQKFIPISFPIDLSLTLNSSLPSSTIPNNKTIKSIIKISPDEIPPHLLLNNSLILCNSESSAQFVPSQSSISLNNNNDKDLSPHFNHCLVSIPSHLPLKVEKFPVNNVDFEILSFENYANNLCKNNESDPNNISNVNNNESSSDINSDSLVQSATSNLNTDNQSESRIDVKVSQSESIINRGDSCYYIQSESSTLNSSSDSGTSCYFRQSDRCSISGSSQSERSSISGSSQSDRCSISGSSQSERSSISGRSQSERSSISGSSQSDRCSISGSSQSDRCSISGSSQSDRSSISGSSQSERSSISGSSQSERSSLSGSEKSEWSSISSQSEGRDLKWSSQSERSSINGSAQMEGRSFNGSSQLEGRRRRSLTEKSQSEEEDERLSLRRESESRKRSLDEVSSSGLELRRDDEELRWILRELGEESERRSSSLSKSPSNKRKSSDGEECELDFDEFDEFVDENLGGSLSYCSSIQTDSSVLSSNSSSSIDSPGSLGSGSGGSNYDYLSLDNPNPLPCSHCQDGVEHGGSLSFVWPIRLDLDLLTTLLTLRPHFFSQLEESLSMESSELGYSISSTNSIDSSAPPIPLSPSSNEPSPPHVQVDDSPLQPSMDKNKESLKVKLLLRRPMNQLVEQGILPPPKTPPAFAEQRVRLERARMGDLLKAKIQQRPDRQELIRQHILEDSNERVAPSLAEKQRMLKRARLADSLNDHLIHRPGPLELVKKNILHAPDATIEQAIKEGVVPFKATYEGSVPGPHPPPNIYLSEDESSSSDLSSPALTPDTSGTTPPPPPPPPQLPPPPPPHSSLDQSEPRTVSASTNERTEEQLSSSSSSAMDQPMGGENGEEGERGGGTDFSSPSTTSVIESSPLLPSSLPSEGGGERSPYLLSSSGARIPVSGARLPERELLTRILQSVSSSSSPPPPTLLPNAAGGGGGGQLTLSKLSNLEHQQLMSGLSSGSSGLSSSSGSRSSGVGMRARSSSKKSGSKMKSVPKARQIKFHEYKGPPSAVSKGAVHNAQAGDGESSYELLLQQQQLFLQWQLECRHKYPQIILPAVSKLSSPTEVTRSLASAVSAAAAAAAVSLHPSSIVASKASPPPVLPPSSICRIGGGVLNSIGGGGVISSIGGGGGVISNIGVIGGGGGLINNIGGGGGVISNIGGGVISSISEGGGGEMSPPPPITVQALVEKYNKAATVPLKMSIPVLRPKVDGSGGEKDILMSKKKQENNETNKSPSAKGGNLSSVKVLDFTKLNDWKVNDLKAELKKRNLPVSGAKPQLIERLKTSDSSLQDEAISSSSSNSKTVKTEVVPMDESCSSESMEVVPVPDPPNKSDSKNTPSNTPTSSSNLLNGLQSTTSNNSSNITTSNSNSSSTISTTEDFSIDMSGKGTNVLNAAMMSLLQSSSSPPIVMPPHILNALANIAKSGNFRPPLLPGPILNPDKKGCVVDEEVVREQQRQIEELQIALQNSQAQLKQMKETQQSGVGQKHRLALQQHLQQKMHQQALQTQLQKLIQLSSLQQQQQQQQQIIGSKKSKPLRLPPPPTLQNSSSVTQLPQCRILPKEPLQKATTAHSSPPPPPQNEQNEDIQRANESSNETGVFRGFNLLKMPEGNGESSVSQLEMTESTQASSPFQSENKSSDEMKNQMDHSWLLKINETPSLNSHEGESKTSYVKKFANFFDSFASGEKKDEVPKSQVVPKPRRGFKSQMVDDVLEILIRNGELPASAAQEPQTPSTPSKSPRVLPYPTVPPPLSNSVKSVDMSENSGETSLNNQEMCVNNGEISHSPPPPPPLPPPSFALTLPTSITFPKSTPLLFSPPLLSKEAQILKISQDLSNFGRALAAEEAGRNSHNAPGGGTMLSGRSLENELHEGMETKLFSGSGLENGIGECANNGGGGAYVEHKMEAGSGLENEMSGDSNINGGGAYLENKTFGGRSLVKLEHGLEAEMSEHGRSISNGGVYNENNVINGGGGGGVYADAKMYDGGRSLVNGTKEAELGQSVFSNGANGVSNMSNNGGDEEMRGLDYDQNALALLLDEVGDEMEGIENGGGNGEGIEYQNYTHQNGYREKGSELYEELSDLEVTMPMPMEMEYSDFFESLLPGSQLGLHHVPHHDGGMHGQVNGPHIPPPTSSNTIDCSRINSINNSSTTNDNNITNNGFSGLMDCSDPFSTNSSSRDPLLSSRSPYNLFNGELGSMMMSDSEMKSVGGGMGLGMSEGPLWDYV